MKLRDGNVDCFLHRISIYFISILSIKMIADNEGRIQVKLKTAPHPDPVTALKQFISVRPIGVKNIKLISKDLDIGEKDHDRLIGVLNEEECQHLIDYLQRFMQFVGETEDVKITANNMLKLYERIIKEHGPSIIISANFRPDTLVSRVSNGF